MDHEREFVEEVVIQKGADERGAALYGDVLAGLAFELADGFRDVSFDEGRVSPFEGFFEGRGDYVFWRVVYVAREVEVFNAWCELTVFEV